MGSRTAALIGSVLLLCALVACGSGDAGTDRASNEPAGSQGVGTATSTIAERPDGDATDPADAADGPAVPSAGCSSATGAGVQLERRDVPVAELTRWYLITVPGGDASTATGPRPLVLDFHGLTEGAVAHAQMSGIGTYAQAHGFVAVIPQGAGDLARWAAAPGGQATGANADVDFAQALLDQVEATECIDLSRVYATGLSNGAMLSSMLACRMADRLAAVAPIAGVTAYDACSPTDVVPMLTIHGTADPILLFNGGVGDIVKLLSGGAGAGGTTLPPTTTIPVDVNGPGYPAAVAAWAERNGCDPEAHDEPVSATVTHRTYDCPTGADVEMYIVAGGGHAWPGSELSRSLVDLLGPTTFDIDATDLAWQFFQRFRRAG